MGKTALKAIASIGSGGVTSAALWLIALTGLDLTSPIGLAIVTLVGSLATWFVAKAVAANGPAPAPAE